MSCQERTGTHFLEGTRREAELDSQHLIFFENVLLKALYAVGLDSMACQCLNCSHLCASFPKCTYFTSKGYKSVLLTCTFSWLFFWNPSTEVSPSLGFSLCDATAEFLIAPSFPCSSHLPPCLFAEHCRQGGRLLGVNLSSPISAPFLLHHNPFPFSMFWLFVAGKHLRLFFSLKCLAGLILTVLILPLLSHPLRCFLCCFCVTFCTLDETPTLLPP